MDEIIVIKVMNEAQKRVLMDKGENTDKNDKIEKYLQDEAFFYKINKETAFKILTYVGVNKQELENTYNKLVCPAVFYRLIREDKLRVDDPSVIIKYR